ncbi:LysR family transcriptional regulator [Halomonas stenophila]|uniref:DNA-binding transcriptional LysR family regulator n=1 Tax=Halomonas stenophila TaxID=795312 RepID=A0A7W5EVH5_9GAMM|nr:LysR family transcriptional regulator [Halomonas stenophila]MBB3232158.1 DNA-binding transcriptional LysR family regulator [Halomonas stenophila]
MTPPAHDGRLTPDWFLDVRLKCRHLQLLAALDEHRNLHRAAASLAISQPAASKLLAELEARLDVRLFERHARGLDPNWYGEIMVRRARSMLSELQQTGDELNALRAGNAGRVSVGTVMDPAVTLLSQALEATRSDLPGLKVSVDVDVSQRLIPRLVEGELDIALCRIPAGFDHGQFVFEEIGEEVISLICRHGHPLTATAAPELVEMIDYPWSLQPPGALMRQRFDYLLSYHGLAPPKQVVDTPDILVSLALVAASDTLTVTTREVAELLCDPQRFCLLPTPQPVNVQPYGLVTLRAKRLSPGAAALTTQLREVIRRREIR